MAKQATTYIFKKGEHQNLITRVGHLAVKLGKMSNRNSSEAGKLIARLTMACDEPYRFMVEEKITKNRK